MDFAMIVIVKFLHTIMLNVWVASKIFNLEAKASVYLNKMIQTAKNFYMVNARSVQLGTILISSGNA